MNSDILKFDITKIDFKNIKTMNGIVIVFLLFVLILDVFLFLPLIHDIGIAQVHRKQNESVVGFFKNLTSKKDKLTTVQIIPQERIDDLLDKIQTVAKDDNIEAKIDVSLETPKKDSNENFYVRKYFSMEAFGSLKDLGVFFTTLRSMPDAILDIDSIHISGDNKNVSNLHAQITFAVLTTVDNEN